jgi:hypothetical protein
MRQRSIEATLIATSLSGCAASPAAIPASPLSLRQLFASSRKSLKRSTIIICSHASLLLSAFMN